MINHKSSLSTKLVLVVELTLCLFHLFSRSCGARRIHLEEPTNKMRLGFPQSNLNWKSREKEEICCPSSHFVISNF